MSNGKTLSDWATEVHLLARSKGWWNAYTEANGTLRPLTADELLGKLMLIDTETAEAAEEVRLPDFNPQAIKYGASGKPEGFGIELADALIRILDTAKANHIDIEQCVRIKHAFNASRSERHGGKRA